MVYKPRNDKRLQADISRIILVYRLPLQLVILRLGLGFGLGLKATIFGLGLEAQVLGLGLVPCDLVNIIAANAVSKYTWTYKHKRASAI